MKHLSKVSFLITLISLCTLASCTKDEVTNLSLSKTTLGLNVGLSDSITLSASITGDIAKQEITWNVSAPSIISVTEGTPITDTQDGLSKTIRIKALASGTATITIQAGKKTETCVVTVNKTTLTFTQNLTRNFGDLYDTGNNTFVMAMFPGTMTVDGLTNNVTGNGTFLVLDLQVPISQSNVTATTYSASENSEINTFFPGGLALSGGDTIVVGSYLTTVSGNASTITFISDGSLAVTTVGSTYKIEGDLTTETDEVVHISYSGIISVSDKREAPVELIPALTKGQLVYYGDAYQSGKSNTFIVYLGSSTVTMTSTSISGAGDVLALQLNTALTAKDSIPSGTYNMMSEFSSSALIPKTIMPAYYNASGYEWGTWFYGVDTTKKIKTGSAIVSRSGTNYNINYQLYDRFGSKVSGTFTGPLSYVNATTSTGVKGIAGGKKPTELKKCSFKQLKSLRPIPIKYHL